MKKNILKTILIATFALFAGYNVYSSQKSDIMSDLTLANVEALASSRETTYGLLPLAGEHGTGGCINCPESSDTSCNC